MPTVPAAGYRQGPTAPPQIDPRLPVDDFLRIDARPEAFGGAVGTALTRAGGELEKGAGELAQAAISRQDFFNKVASDNANTEFMKESHKLFYGDPDAGVNPVTGQANKPGFFALKGQDAIDAGPPNDALDKLQRDIAARLPNDRARLDFNTETRRLRTYQDGEISRHWDEQLKTAGTTTLAAKADLHDRDAATYFNDPTRLADILETGRQDATKAAQIANGMNADPAILADARAKSDAKVYGSAYRAAIAAGQLDRADALKNEAIARGIWTGQQADEAERLIEPKRNQQIGKDAGRAGFTGGGGAGGGAAIGPPVQGPVTPQQVAAAATRNGTDPLLANATAAIESAHGANAGSPTKKYAGVYQMGADERVSVGGSADSIGSLEDQVEQGTKLLAKRKQELAASLGREPTNAEVYLAHQQGVAGATALINNPNTPAGQVVPSQNISSNAGNPSLPASAFVQHWQQVYNQKEAQFKGVTPSAPPTPSPGASAAPIEVRGDSLGVGLKGRLGGAGNAVGGASPTAIFDDIKTEPESHWQGKTVVLPSGSNGNQMPVVEDTIKYLQNHGANVIAVGYGPKFPEKNAQLAEIAGRLKVPVIAAEDVSPSEGVHPSPRGYQSMADKIRAAAGGAPGKPQTAPEGAIISSPGKPPMQNVGGKWVPYLPEGV